MATIYVISLNASLYPLAYRLHREGHDVSYFTSPTQARLFLWEEGKGPKIRFEPTDEAADFYLLDAGGSGGFGDALARERKTSLGGSRLAVKAALDPVFKAKVETSLFRPNGPAPDTSIPFLLSGIFDGENWISPIGLSLLQHRLMEGERGLHIGISGALLSLAPTRFAIGEGVTSFLSKAGYKGHLTLQGRVDGEKIWWEGINLSCDVPFLLLWSEMLKCTLYELLFGLSTSTLKRINLRQDPFSLALRMSVIPSWEDIPIPLLSLEDEKHTWLDMGGGGLINLGWITARGVDISEARRRIYRTLERSQPHPLVQYRRDVGASLEAKYASLQNWGWC